MLVIGTGAVGCAVAIAAVNAGMETALLSRNATAKYIREHGLKRTGIFGEITITPDRIAVHEDYDCVYEEKLMAEEGLKTTANESVARELAAHRDILGQTGRIVIFQNGWGNDEPYLAYFPASQIFNARVITGFARSASGVTNVTVHTAPILLGSLHGAPAKEMEPLARAIADSGIPSETSEEKTDSSENLQISGLTQDQTTRVNSPLINIETLGPKQTMVGKESEYKIAVENRSSQQAANLVVRTAIPEDVDITSINASAGASHISGEDSGQLVCLWNHGDFAPEQKEQLPDRAAVPLC